MSFVPPLSPGDRELVRADQAEAKRKAARYSQLHGGDDARPPTGPLQRLWRRITGRGRRAPQA